MVDMKRRDFLKVMGVLIACPSVFVHPVKKKTHYRKTAYMFCRSCMKEKICRINKNGIVKKTRLNVIGCIMRSENKCVVSQHPVFDLKLNQKGEQNGKNKIVVTVNC